MNKMLHALLFLISFNVVVSESYEIAEVFPFSCSFSYDDQTWGEAQIDSSNGTIPYAAPGFHLGQNIFDSLRWYRGFDGKYRIFRPDYKIERMNYGSTKMNLVQIPKRLLFKCFVLFIQETIRRNIIPDSAKNESVYFRALYFTTENKFLHDIHGSAKVVIIGSLGNDKLYFKYSNISARVETEIFKNFDGSLAYIKTATNYGPIFGADAKSTTMGYTSTIFLYPHKCRSLCLAELSGGNLFIVQRDTQNPERRILVTLHEKYILFPGSYRNSTIQLSAKIPNVVFKKRCIEVRFLQQRVSAGIIVEMFTTGHYNQVIPITEVYYNGAVIKIPTLSQADPIYLKIKRMLANYFYGVDKSGYFKQWMYCINEAGDGLVPCTA